MQGVRAVHFGRLKRILRGLTNDVGRYFGLLVGPKNACWHSRPLRYSELDSWPEGVSQAARAFAWTGLGSFDR